MDPLLCLWAKLGNDGYDQRHPLLCHLIDVAAVSCQMWDRVLRREPKRWLASSLGLESDTARCWLAFWVGAHDIGKAVPWFQNRDDRTARLVDELRPHGLEFWDNKNVPHG